MFPETRLCRVEGPEVRGWQANGRSPGRLGDTSSSKRLRPREGARIAGRATHWLPEAVRAASSPRPSARGTPGAEEVHPLPGGAHEIGPVLANREEPSAKTGPWEEGCHRRRVNTLTVGDLLVSSSGPTIRMQTLDHRFPQSWIDQCRLASHAVEGHARSGPGPRRMSRRSRQAWSRGPSAGLSGAGGLVVYALCSA